MSSSKGFSGVRKTRSFITVLCNRPLFCTRSRFGSLHSTIHNNNDYNRKVAQKTQYSPRPIEKNHIVLEGGSCLQRVVRSSKICTSAWNLDLQSNRRPIQMQESHMPNPNLLPRLGPSLLTTRITHSSLCTCAIRRTPASHSEHHTRHYA